MQDSYDDIREVSLKDAWKRLRSSGQFDGFVSCCPAQGIHAISPSDKKY
jgi:hypothetical protein